MLDFLNQDLFTRNFENSPAHAPTAEERLWENEKNGTYSLNNAANLVRFSQIVLKQSHTKAGDMLISSISGLHICHKN